MQGWYAASDTLTAREKVKPPGRTLPVPKSPDTAPNIAYLGGALKHTLKTGHRTVTLTITEEADRVVLAFEFSKTGPAPDQAQINEWVGTLTRPYDKDQRPFQITNPHSGEVATIYGDDKSFVATIEKRKDIN